MVAILSRIRDWINMRKFSNLKASAAPMVLGLAMVSTPAFAQDQDVQDDDPNCCEWRMIKLGGTAIDQHEQIRSM